MAKPEIQIQRSLTETITAGDVIVSIDFDGDVISAVRASYQDDEGDRGHIKAPPDVFERIGQIVHQQRRYAHSDGREICNVHGYVKPKQSKGYGCSVCEPDTSEDEKASALVEFALRKQNVEVKSIKPAPGKNAVGFLIETPTDIWHAQPNESVPGGWRFLAIEPSTLPEPL